MCFPATVAVQLFSYWNGIKYAVWYNNATLFVAAFSIFAFMARIKAVKDNAAIKNLAICSFGIYLIHNPIIMLLIRNVSFTHSSVRVIVVFAITVAISWSVVYCISQIRHIGKVLFFIK